MSWPAESLQGGLQIKKKRPGISSIICSMMRDGSIAFVDSGIGGIPYLLLSRQELPEERFVYLADQGHFPYGEKDPEELRALLVRQLERLFALTEPKAVVLACNTASVVALDFLRRRFEVPFVGVVPAVKPAAEQSPAGRIGIMATSRTVSDHYTQQLIESFASHCRVFLYAGTEVVDFVENRLADAESQERRTILQGARSFFRRHEIDTLVLGCTHFIHMEAEMRGLFGPGVHLVDSRAGVVRQLRRVLGREGLRGTAQDGGDTFFYSGDLKPVTRRLIAPLGFGEVRAL